MNQLFSVPASSDSQTTTSGTIPVGLSRRAALANGQPIGRLMAQALRYPSMVSLAAGFVDNATLPCESTKQCLENLCSDTPRLRRALQYETSAGNAELRECIVDWSYRAWPAEKPSADRAILTAGSNQFLHLLAEAIIDPGDIVIAAAPTYFVYMGTLKGVEARVIGVHSDEEGICIDALEEHLQRLADTGQAARVKAIYTVTDFDNPSGSTLSLSRRKRLLEIVAKWRRNHGPLLIISDNAYQQLRYEGETIAPFTALDTAAAEFVVELGTFSKSFSPGVRVGWGIVPSNLVHTLLEMKSNIDFGSPHFGQALMLEVIRSGEFERHLPVILDGYRSKLHVMLDALDLELSGVDGVAWRRPKGGLYIWLTLPEHVDASESGPLWPIATERGVLYVPGHYCYPTEGEPVGMNTIRLSFGVQNAEGIKEGIKRLADAVKAVLAARS